MAPAGLRRASRRHRLRPWLRRALLAAGLCTVAFATTFVVAWFACPFPTERLDRWPVSPLVTDRTGRPIWEMVDTQDEWRRPVALGEISPWLVQATIAVEDRRFYHHIGVDPVAILRAAAQDVLSAHVVSGASTLSMQVSRMVDDGPRTFPAKALQMLHALQLEHLRTKAQILESYLNLAPYGGNLRGAQAASLRYWGKPARDLSLGEAALLAGLPQSPTRHRPDRHLASALARRQTVLRRMQEEGFITPGQRAAAQREPVVLRPPAQRELINNAATLALSRRPGGGQTTVDPEAQRLIEQEATAFTRTLPPGPPPASLAVVVIDIATGDILAMVGSADAHERAAGQVNAAIAPRSPGSALKPFIYAAAFEAGRLAPDSTVYDIPITRGAWSPADFDRHFDGPMTAADALRRSRNVPAILVAEGVGLERCLGVIEAAGAHLPRNAATRGGLAVATGALEVSLLDLTNAYATLGRRGLCRDVRLFPDQPATPARRVLSAEACAAVNDILSTHHRTPRNLPGELAMADSPPPLTAWLPAAADSSNRKLAIPKLAILAPWFMWKTGTSSGRRDGWAVGHNAVVAVGVWVGAPSGARSDWAGGEVAEPLLARIFHRWPMPSRADPAVAPPLPPAPAIAVRRPLPLPPELATALHILWPTDHGQFLAAGDRVVLHPRANHDQQLTWFVNGQAVGQADPLALTPGRYELRCADVQGAADAVSFEVK